MSTEAVMEADEGENLRVCGSNASLARPIWPSVPMIGEVTVPATVPNMVLPTVNLDPPEEARSPRKDRYAKDH